MKKTLLTLAFIACCLTVLLSQPCLPDGITFTTQAQIDNFQINHPDCTEIEGDVEIGNWDWTNINNLFGLNTIESIGGNLKIYLTTLTSLTGLESLNTIGGDFSIGLFYPQIGWIGNPSLANLSGLDNLITIEGNFMIAANDALTSMEGLEGVTTIGGQFQVARNDALTSLTGLEGVNSIVGDLFIHENYNLTSLTGLEGVTSIGGFLAIQSNSAFASLTGMEELTSIGGYLLISGSNVLTSLTGLEGVTSIGGFLAIQHNSAFASLTGMEGLASIGGELQIAYNDALTSLMGLEGVTSIGGYLMIAENDALTSLQGLDDLGAGSIDSLFILENPLLTICEVQSICDYLAAPGGTIEIHDNAPGCNSQQEVEAACWTSVEEIGLEDSFSISPNPCSASANLRFAINEQGFVIFDLFEISGVKIKTLLNEVKKPGTYELEIDLSDLSKGIYFCVLLTDEGSQSKKLIKR